MAKKKKTKRDVAGKEDGLWPEDCIQRAFVAGAKWWQFHANGSTAFPSEQDQMAEEAVRRYGDPGLREDADESDRPFVVRTDAKGSIMSCGCEYDLKKKVTKECTRGHSSIGIRSIRIKEP